MSGVPIRTLAMDGKTVLVKAGGVIRFGDNGPYLHENSAHVAPGLESVKVTWHGDLELLVTDPCGRVISAMIGCDETLVTRDITAGLSGGGRSSIIRMAERGERIDLRSTAGWRKVAGPTSNVWVDINGIDK